MAVISRTVRPRSPRPYSIKTRIKTQTIVVCSLRETGSLRDHIPLKQGLRQGAKKMIFCCIRHKSLNSFSIITRIKTRNSQPRRSSLRVLRDHFPLKQGLRLVYHISRLKKLFPPRPSSIKTRTSGGFKKFEEFESLRRL